MADRALSDDFEHAQGGNADATPASDVDAFDVDDPQERLRASDGDGAMLGRVLIYASIITVVIAVILWNRFA
jgi:hypothetical protein